METGSDLEFNGVYSPLPIEPVMFLFKPHTQAKEIYKDEQFRFRFNLVKFWEEDGQTILESNAFVLYPFIPLMAGEDELIIQAEQKLYNSNIAKEDKTDLLTALAIFAGMRNKDLAITLIRRRRDMTIESPVYEWLTREAAEEGLKKGLLEGYQKGQQEGRELGLQKGHLEGQIQEAQIAVIDNLKFRYQPIPPELLKKICAIQSVELLRELRKQAILIQSLEEFEKLLVK